MHRGHYQFNPKLGKIFIDKSVRRLRAELTPKSFNLRAKLALKTLKHILIEGSRDHKSMVIEEGVIPSLKRLLSESLDEIVAKDSINSQDKDSSVTR